MQIQSTVYVAIFNNRIIIWQVIQNDMDFELHALILSFKSLILK